MMKSGANGAVMGLGRVTTITNIFVLKNALTLGSGIGVIK